MHNFKELQVWQRSMQLAVDIYSKTGEFPVDERFGLTSQLRRSAVSVPSNIAEGCGRHTDKALASFLTNSLGSQFEMETQLILSNHIGYLSDTDSQVLNGELNEIQKMTNGLIAKFSV